MVLKKAPIGSAVIAIILFALPCCRPDAVKTQPEKYYQQAWCEKENGIQEYRLPDGNRCDCLTPTHAVEVEFARKWAEAIGQSLYYASQTGKRAGIVLIMKGKGDGKYWDRLQRAIDVHQLPIDVWKE